MKNQETGLDFDQVRARVALFLGPLLFFVIWFAPLPLPQEAHRLAAVMALTVIFWIGEPIPLWATALGGPTLALLLHATGAATEAENLAWCYAKFFDPILLLFVGGFLIAKALDAHKVDRRIALRMLAIPAFGATPARMVMGLGLCAGLLSMWTTNTAVTAIMIPIATGILGFAKEQSPKSALARAMILMLPFAATVGGLATPIGTAPNLIGLAALRKE